jgi:hypothetical protein
MWEKKELLGWSKRVTVVALFMTLLDTNDYAY